MRVLSGPVADLSGRFALDMNSRLELEPTATAAAVPGPRGR
ncbi:hypothetical protein [Microbispora sp. H10830]|nr:hypothetical protein [Microbispora sp. H10830]